MAVAAAVVLLMLELPIFSVLETRGGGGGGVATVAAAVIVALLPLLPLLPVTRLLLVVMTVVVAIVFAGVDADIAEEVGRLAEAAPDSLRGAVVVDVGAGDIAGGVRGRCWPWPCRGWLLSPEEATATAPPPVPFYPIHTTTQRKTIAKYKEQERNVRRDH